MKESECRICSMQFNSKSKLIQHFNDSHTGFKPYVCIDCKLGFTYEKDLKRHVVSKHPKNDKTSHKFEEYRVWLINTKLINEKDTNRVISDYCKFNDRYNIDISEISLSSFLDAVDDWINVNISLGKRKSTVSSHIKHIRLFIEYTFKDEQNEIVRKLHSISSKLSLQSTNDIQSETAVCILDPDKLIIIRNKFVKRLMEKQVYYDQIITDFLRRRTKHQKSHLIEFGLEFRCWIELCIRFTNIAHRTQASSELVLPNVNVDKFVCKLVKKNGMFYRVWYCDKTGNCNNQRPIECSLGITLSSYMQFYIDCCRVTGKCNYVYTERNGSGWGRLARDVKIYCNKTLNININEVDPSGRFTHFIRHISLATYAYGCSFDLNKMHRFATLMRHSFSVMNKYYTTWNKWYISQMSANEYFQIMGLQHDQTDVHNNIQKKCSHSIIQLKKPPPLVIYLLSDGDISENYNISFSDSSTQTDEENVTNYSSCILPVECDVHPLDNAPLCTLCKESMSIHGPIGLTRSEKFGCYYYTCNSCKTTNQKKLYLPKGFISKYSDSTKPRNKEYIDKVHSQWSELLHLPVRYPREDVEQSLKRKRILQYPQK